MKKSAGILGVIVVLGIAYTGASWYMGKQAQATIEQGVAQGNMRIVKALGPDLGGSGLKIAIENYQRGIFSSDVAYKLSFNKKDGKPGEIKMVDHLQHGPLPLDALRAGQFKPLLALSNARLVPTPEAQKWFDSLNGQSPVTVVTRVGFSGSGTSSWQFKPLDIANGGDTTKFSGGVVDVTLSNHFKDSVAVGHFDSLETAQAKTKSSLQIKGVKINSKTSTTGQNQDQTQLQSAATIDSMAMASSDADTVKVDNWTINVDSLQKGNILDGTLRYDFGRIQVGDADMGSLSVGAKGSNLDVNALGDLAAEYDALQVKHGVTDDQVLNLTDEESAVMRQKLLAVLASNPSVSIAPFDWKNDKGESKLAFGVNLSGPASKDSTQPLDALLPEIFKQVTLDMSISRPMMVQVLNQSQGSDGKSAPDGMGAMIFDQYAGKLQSLGLAKADGDKVVVAIRYQDNKVQVNGQKMSVMEFAQRAMGLIM